MAKTAKLLRIVGWILILGELAFMAVALMSPTATLPGPVEVVYDGLVALFGGYRAGGALRLWFTVVITGIVMLIAARILRKKSQTQ